MNLYNIVTNDEYELPIACDIEGAKAVGEFLGVSDAYVNKHVSLDKWPEKMKYKAVVIDFKYVTLEHGRMLNKERCKRWYRRRAVSG